MSKSTADNMQSVTSNAVYSALNGLVKYKELTINAQANSYAQSSLGLYYKEYINVVSEIGAGHTLIGLVLRDWSNTKNYPFGFYLGDSGKIGIWTTNQAFSGNLPFRLVYI